MNWIRNAPVLSLALTLFPLAPSVAENHCDKGAFETKRSVVNIELGLARVLKPDNATRSAYVGTAFVIDAKDGYLLTARHVAEEAIQGDLVKEGDSLVLSFPKIDELKRVRATLRARFDPDDEVRIEDYIDHTRDLALLQIEDESARKLVRQLSLAFNFQKSKKATLYSYFDAARTAVLANGEVSIPSHELDIDRGAKCTFTLTGLTDGGDSGGPILDESGHVIGMVIQDQPRGEADRKTAISLRSDCFKKDIVKDFRSRSPMRARQIAMEILTTKESALARRLYPSSDGNDAITNFEFVAGLEELGEMLMQATSQPLEGEITMEKYVCPLVPAAMERRVWPLPEPILVALASGPIGTDSVRERADEVLGKAKKSLEAGQMLVAAAQAELSRIMYEDAISKSRIFDKIENIAELSEDAREKLKSTSEAQVFKGLTDSQILLGNVIVGEGLGDARAVFEKAQAAAMAAVILSPGDNKELRGESYVAHATASMMLQQYQQAIESYALAAADGIRHDWAEKSYRFAYEKRDNRRLAESASDYSPLNNYWAKAPEVIGDFELNFLAHGERISRRVSDFHGGVELRM